MLLNRFFPVLLLFFALPACAEPFQGVGFAAGQISGLGLSYRMMSTDYGAQITVGALSRGYENNSSTYSRGGYYDPDYPPTSASKSYVESYGTRETHANIGLMFFKKLHSAKWSTLYAFTGFSTFYRSDTYEDQKYELVIKDETMYEYVPVGEPQKRTETTNTFYGGFGIGIEIKFTANIRLALEWPLTFSSEGDFVMYFPQMGFHYFF